MTRGPDWEYGNQDGGIGRFGTVKKITDWQGKPASAAVVSWQSGTEGTYRLGYQGKVSLMAAFNISVLYRNGFHSSRPI